MDYTAGAIGGAIGLGEQLAKQQALDMQLRQPSVLESLQQQRASVVQRLESIDRAIAALEANPGIEEVLTLLGKVGRY